jgi:hypothetical protein
MKTLKRFFLLTACLLCLFVTRAQVPVLSSYTAAPATIFLDFDGHYVTGSLWNWYGPIDAQPAALTPAAITEIFNRVSEDFRPFNLNVTTDSSYYWNAPVNKRIRIIVTPTYQWYVPAGGVAFVGSFIYGDNTPAWVFSSLLANNPKTVAEAISHEAGHTLGLQHQSDFDNNCIKIREYSSGAGSGEIGWAPIMGVGYNKNLTTWHYGTNTAGCTYWQDDFAIINSTNNGFGLKPDDHLNDNANATPVLVSGGTFLISGLINNAADIDVFKLSFATDNQLSIDATPENVGANNAGANIDIKLSLLDAAGDTIARYNPTTLLNAGIDTLLGAGDYYFVIDGTGNANHSDYGSMGRYTIRGFVGNVILPVTDFLLNVQNQEGKHLLSWNYQAGEIIENTVVESSADGLTFTPVATVEGAARSFTHKPVSNGPMYYRVKVITAKNQTAYLSNVVHTKQIGPVKKIQLMPRTNSGTVSLYSSGRFNYQLLTAQGQLLQSGTLVAGNNQINTGSIKGLLIIRYSDGVTHFSEKIVQQ